MLKQQARLLTRIAVGIDVVVIVCAFVLAYQTRLSWGVGVLLPLQRYAWVLAVILPVWLYFAFHFGIYGSLRTFKSRHIWLALCKLHIATAIVSSSAIYLLDPHVFSRGLFVLFYGYALGLSATVKLLIRALLGLIRRQGLNCRHLLIVGVNEESRMLAQMIQEHTDWGLQIVGYLAWDDREGNAAVGPVLGNLDTLLATCRSRAIDEVIFCIPADRHVEIEEPLHALQGMGITVRTVLPHYALRCQRKEFSVFNDQLAMVTYYNRPFNEAQLFLKRCLDIVGALVGLLLTALIFPFVALAIKGTSPGPIFFGQQRVRENGRLFTCWKFRSMQADAEARKSGLLHLNEMNGAIFKIKNDPRLTPVGAFLRKTSLDEFPQFWNVLTGEMSLVGTRPPTPEEVVDYADWQRKRICIKPGITGMWQVGGRNQITDFDDIVRMDIDYIDRWSLWLDIKLIFKTLWVVLMRRGSC